VKNIRVFPEGHWGAGLGEPIGGKRGFKLASWVLSGVHRGAAVSERPTFFRELPTRIGVIAFLFAAGIAAAIIWWSERLD
jgi:hypothetical protein